MTERVSWTEHVWTQWLFCTIYRDASNSGLGSGQGNISLFHESMLLYFVIIKLFKMCIYFLRPSFLFISCHVFENFLTFATHFPFLHILHSTPNGFFSWEQLGLLTLMSYFLLGHTSTIRPPPIPQPVLNSSQSQFSSSSHSSKFLLVLRTTTSLLIGISSFLDLWFHCLLFQPTELLTSCQPGC